MRQSPVKKCVAGLQITHFVGDVVSDFSGESVFDE